MLEDTGMDKYTCRYCGKTMGREELGNQPEEFRRRLSVQTLTATIKRSKDVKVASYGLAAGLLVISTVFLLFETGYDAPFLELILLVALYASGIVWLVIGFVASRQLDRDKSKMFDITGGRSIDFKY